jgi:catechol-2,3-dioxygenase
MAAEARSAVISVMLAVTDAAAAARWYSKALGLPSCGTLAAWWGWP